MRNSVIEAKQWIFDILKAGGVRNVISGEIYKDYRPAGSVKEDIVINSITINNTFFQTGVFNVNCYVPYLKMKINSIDQNVQNETRLIAINNAVKPLLENRYTNRCNIDIEFSTVVTDEKDCYISYRIKLNAYN